MHHTSHLRRWAGLLLLAASAGLTGCASGPNAQKTDPLEPLNRGIYQLNDSVDAALLKPAATLYQNATPAPVRTGVSNFFSNLGDVWSLVNAVLQLRPRQATETLVRLNVNTILGFGGVLDIASEMGIPRNRLDFGQTLGRWGVPSGPYLVLPILGPSSLRDAVGFGVQVHTDDGVQNLDHVPTRNALKGLEIVQTRASLLRASAMLEDSALDPYSFTRDFYLRRRHSQIQDATGAQDAQGEEAVSHEAVDAASALPAVPEPETQPDRP